jgi:hypothetical protein
MSASSSPLKLLQGGQGEPATDGTLALKRTDHTPSDPVSAMEIERAENGYVLRCIYPEGDERILIFAPHLKEQFMQAIASRL